MIGARFLDYLCSVAGNNAIGSISNFTSFVLSRSMKSFEIVINGLILIPISNVVGLPLILNGTQEILACQGMSLQEYPKIRLAFQIISNSTMVQKTKKNFITNNKRKKDPSIGYFLRLLFVIKFIASGLVIKLKIKKNRSLTFTKTSI